MYTLHHAAELRTIDEVEELSSVQVIDAFDRPLDLADFKDDYLDGLKKVIEAKIAGQQVVAPTLEAPAPVANLMEALHKSLNAVSAGKKRQAKAVAAPVATKRKRA